MDSYQIQDDDVFIGALGDPKKTKSNTMSPS